MASSSTSAGKRFELPQLSFNFSSLTEGTNIPPPPDSPKEVPTPPKTPTVGATADAKAAAASTGASNGAAATATATQATAPAAATAEGDAQSQSSPTNGSASLNRPMSRSNGSILDEKKAKRSSGFFRRFRSSDASGKRASVMYEHQAGSQSKNEVRGPPPPMIPELSALESKVDVGDGGSLGSDLFKNIK